MKDFYAVLGIASDATHSEVTQAYRRKALKFHPDDENRRRNLLDKPLDTAREIWQHYLKGVLQ